MGSHPVNLALRFILELAALVAMGVWGWQNASEWSQYGLAIGVPLVGTFLWVVFAVPNDPSRGGIPLVPVPGMVRIALELVFFAFAAWALHDVGAPWLGWAFGLAVIAHYVASIDRVLWLLGK